MKNVVLIALVVLVIAFAVQQYDPSFFGLFGSSEGFEDNGKNPLGSPLANHRLPIERKAEA